MPITITVFFKFALHYLLLPNITFFFCSISLYRLFNLFVKLGLSPH